MDYKVVISCIVVIMTIIGYVPYFRDLLARKTTPHVFTWFIWTLTIGVLCALQVKGGAGVGSWIMFVITFISGTIFFLSLRNGSKNITTLDILCLILALIGLFLWFGIDQPVWSSIVLISVDILGFIPTVRKSWNDPYSETLSTYQISGIRHVLVIFALEQFNVLTLIFPVVWSVANLLFVFILVARRKIIAR